MSVMRGNGNKLKTDVGILNFCQTMVALPCLMFYTQFYILLSFISILRYLEMKEPKKVKLNLTFSFLSVQYFFSLFCMIDISRVSFKTLSFFWLWESLEREIGRMQDIVMFWWATTLKHRH